MAKQTHSSYRYSKIALCSLQSRHETESPIFVMFCVLSFKKQSLLTFMKAIKVIFHDLLTLLITFILKKKKKKKKNGSCRKYIYLYVKSVPVNTSVFHCFGVFRYYYVPP